MYSSCSFTQTLNSSLTKTQERFDLQYYQKKIREKCGDLSLPSVCFYVEWDGTQKYVTITEQGYSLSIIKPHSFFRELKLYHKNTVLKMEGTKLFMSSVNVGIWREYNAQGILVNEVDEDKKFSLLAIKPLDVLKYIEREGFINLKTGEGQERFDTTNAINICFEDRNESEKDKSKGMSAKWIIKFYNIEMGKVTTQVFNAENRDIISIVEQFLEE